MVKSLNEVEKEVVQVREELVLLNTLITRLHDFQKNNLITSQRALYRAPDTYTPISNNEIPLDEAELSLNYVMTVDRFDKVFSAFVSHEGIDTSEDAILLAKRFYDGGNTLSNLVCKLKYINHVTEDLSWALQ